LRDSLHDSDAAVREWAAGALGNIGPGAADAMADLREMLGGTEGTLRVQVALAITKIAPRGSRRVAVATAPSPAPRAAAAAPPPRNEPEPARAEAASPPASAPTVVATPAGQPTVVATLNEPRAAASPPPSLPSPLAAPAP